MDSHDTTLRVQDSYEDNDGIDPTNLDYSVRPDDVIAWIRQKYALGKDVQIFLFDQHKQGIGSVARVSDRVGPGQAVYWATDRLPEGRQGEATIDHNVASSGATQKIAIFGVASGHTYKARIDNNKAEGLHTTQITVVSGKDMPPDMFHTN